MNEFCEEVLAVTERILEGGDVTREEAERFIRGEDGDTLFLMAMADTIRRRFNGDEVDFCAIINARSGRCPEDCKFCAQSAYHRTGVQEYPLLTEETIVRAAHRAKAAGAVRFSIVTSGRNQGNRHEFEEIVKALRRIRDEVGIEVCCSLGLLSAEHAERLKEAGVTRYHSNIETAPSHFPDICGTHSYEDKMSTIKNAQAAGIRVCSGGILGLNESPEQRVEMAFELKRLGIDSVPLNILNPIEGTPFAHNRPLPPMEILRTFSVFRFVLPKALIRTAGGREVNLRDLQALALTSGLNGVMIGNYLTTSGRPSQSDRQMVRDLGRGFSESDQRAVN